MGNLAPVKDDNLATMSCRKIKINNGIRHILHLPGGQRIIICSWDGSFRAWDLERGAHFSKEWEDKDRGVEAIALSPTGKTVATGSDDGTVKLWNVDTGKVIKKWTGHKAKVHSVCWSPDGGRVVSGCWDATFRVWDLQSEETDGKMMAISLYTVLKILDANTGELLKTIDDVACKCLAWTLDGKTLFAGGWRIRKFDTATWTAVLDGGESFVDTISISPNQRILASTSFLDKTAQLWNLETDQPIGTPLQHEDEVNSAIFSANGKFLVIGCPNGHLYTWDICAIVKGAGLLSDIADAAPRLAPKVKCARRMPTGIFKDVREANLRTRLSRFHGPRNRPTPASSQRILSPFSSFWRNFKPHGATECITQPRSHPLSWTRNLVSSMVRRRDTPDIELQESPVVEIPCIAGKPENYHATGKPAASWSRPPKIHTTQKPSATTQDAPSSSQLPPPIATALAPSAVTCIAEASGTGSSSHMTGAGWRARFMGWLYSMPIQNTDGQH